MFLWFPYNNLSLGIKCNKNINLNENATAKEIHLLSTDYFSKQCFPNPPLPLSFIFQVLTQAAPVQGNKCSINLKH